MCRHSACFHPHGDQRETSAGDDQKHPHCNGLGISAGHMTRHIQGATRDRRSLSPFFVILKSLPLVFCSNQPPGSHASIS